MATQGRKAALVRVFWRRFSILALLIALAFVSLGVWNVYGKEKESRTLRQQAESQQSDLSKQATELNTRIAKLKTDRGKEEALRQQYEVGRAGETLVVIVEPPQEASQQATSSVRQWVRKFLPFW